MLSHLVRYLVLALLLHGTGQVAGDENWPQFRGPEAAGVSATSWQLPSKLSSETTRWKVAVAHGVSSPCVWGSRIFLTGHDAEPKQLITLCLNADTGQRIWEKRSTLGEIPSTHVASSPAAPTIATDGQRIYVYFGLIGVTCYDLDGALLWEKPLPTPHNRHGAGSSPTIVGDKLFLVCDQGELFQSLGSYLLCLDKFTGRELWKRNRPLSGAGWTTPVFWKKDNSLVVLGRRLIAYDLATGDERWWVDGLMDFAVTTPVVGDELIYAVTAAGGFESDRRIKLPSFSKTLADYDANSDGKIEQNELPAELLFYEGDTTGLPGDGVTAREAFVMFDGDKDGFVGNIEWDGAVRFWNQMKNTLVAIRPGGKGDVTQSHVVWRANRQLPEVPSPLYHNDRIYLVKNGGIVTSLEADSGERIFRKRLGTLGNYFSSPVAADGKIYAASDNGSVSVFRAADQLNILSRNDLGEQVIATPAISNGRIYVRSAKHLWCFESR